MRFMVMVKTDERSEAGVKPDQQLLAAMGKYNERLVKAGMMLGGDGLHPSARGCRVKATGKKVTVHDGPFAEAKELVGGYWLLQAKSKEEVVDWIKQVPFRDGEAEIRPLYEVEDFPADASEEAREWRDQVLKVAPRQPGTTRYILLLKADKKSEAGALPTEEGMVAMTALIDELNGTGAMLGGEGLKPSAQGAKVHFADGKRRVVDGPFTETKEIIAGYLLLQTKTKQEAIDWAKRWLDVHTSTPGFETGEIEIRPLLEIEDFPVDPSEKSGGWRDKEKQARGQ